MARLALFTLLVAATVARSSHADPADPVGEAAAASSELAGRPAVGARIDAEQIAVMLTGPDSTRSGFAKLQPWLTAEVNERIAASIQDGRHRVTIGNDDRNSFRFHEPGAHIGGGHGPLLDRPTFIHGKQEAATWARISPTQ